jgi:cytochrome c551/c552
MPSALWSSLATAEIPAGRSRECLNFSYLTLKDFFNPELSRGKLWSIVGLAFVTVMSMATLRHGMRLSLTDEAMAQSKAQSDDFVSRSKAASDEAKNAPKAAATVATVNPGETAANKQGCLACHSVGQKLVGPSYQEVAKKGYTDAQIVELIYVPKPENWPGFIPMPPQSQVSKDDAADIAKWINSLK